MQQEIVKLVASKAGISEPIAKIAVETVLSLLKDKLPAVVGTQLDSFLGADNKKSSKSSQNDTLGGLTDIVSGLGGLFGGKK
jgi:hypothetical protein